MVECSLHKRCDSATVDRSLLGAISIIQKSKDFVAIPIAECRTLSMIYKPRIVGGNVCESHVITKILKKNGSVRVLL